jgi:ribose transport system substrate-binding protein
MDGFTAEISKHSGIKVLGPFPARWPNQVPEAKAQMEALLTQYPAGQINAVVASYDSQGVGAAQAIQEAGRTEIVVIGADGDREVLESIMAGGPFVFTVAQDMAAMGSRAAEIVIGKLQGKEVETGVVYVPAIPVDSSNAKAIFDERFGQ